MRLTEIFRPALILCAVMLCLPSPAHAQQVPQSREQLQLSFSPVVKKAAPAVVNIYTKMRVKVASSVSPLMNDPFFRQFFGGALPGPARERVVSSLGSGVIIDPKGVIVTSNHVIKGAEEITVVLSDKREFEAKVTKRDPQSDLAFLSIPEENLPYLELRDSDTLETGDLVLAIGNPFGVGQTVTSGIISALSRQAQGVSDYQFFIQTDAAINPGNSGGALVDMNGHLIGINTAIYSKTGGSLGIGFAIPANMVRALNAGKTQGDRIVRPWLGLAVQPVTAEIAESLGLPAPKGVIVRAVYPGSPADKSGIKVGDVVLAIGGSDISTEQELRYRVALALAGETKSFSVFKGGKRQDIDVILTTPPENPARDTRTLKGQHPLDGLIVANLSPALAVELERDDVTETGVVVMGASDGSFASELGLARGDIIDQLNDKKVTSSAQLEKLVNAASRSWKINYRRNGRPMQLMVRL